MAPLTLADIRDICYFLGVKFDGLPVSTRIIFAVFYLLIIVSSAVINGLLLYIFVTKSKFRNSSNLVAST